MRSKLRLRFNRLNILYRLLRLSRSQLNSRSAEKELSINQSMWMNNKTNSHDEMNKN